MDNNKKYNISTLRSFYPSYNELNDSDFIKKITEEDPDGVFKSMGIDANKLASAHNIKLTDTDKKTNNDTPLNKLKAFGEGAVDSLNDAYYKLNNHFGLLNEKPKYMQEFNDDVQDLPQYKIGKFAGDIIPYVLPGVGIEKGIAKASELYPALRGLLENKLFRHSVAGAGTGYLTSDKDDALENTLLFGATPAGLSLAGKGLKGTYNAVGDKIGEYLTREYLKKGLTDKINDAVKYGSEKYRSEIGDKMGELKETVSKDQIPFSNGALPFNYSQEYMGKLRNILKDLNGSAGGTELTRAIKSPSNEIIRKSFMDVPNNLQEAIDTYRGLNSNIKNYFSNNSLNTLTSQQQSLLKNTISKVKDNLREYIGKSLDDVNRPDLYDLFNNLNQQYSKNRNNATLRDYFNIKSQNKILNKNDIDWEGFLKKFNTLDTDMSKPNASKMLLGDTNAFKSRALNELGGEPTNVEGEVNSLLGWYDPIKIIKKIYNEAMPWGLSKAIPKKYQRDIIANAIKNQRLSNLAKKASLEEELNNR